jgi:hypothetical protein
MDTVAPEHLDLFLSMDYRHSALRASAGNDGDIQFNPNSA